MTRLYLVRHGETKYNKMGCYYGWTDCSLSLEGVIHGELLSKAFKNIDYDVILSSDLKRAVETAGYINRDKELILDKRLRELNFGKWEGKYYQEIQQLYKEHWEKWTADWKTSAPTEGESFNQMYNRVCECLKELLIKYKDKDIVMVSHNGCLRIILVYLLRLSLDNIWSFSFEHGKYSLLEIQDEHCTIKCINNI